MEAGGEVWEEVQVEGKKMSHGINASFRRLLLLFPWIQAVIHVLGPL